MPRVRARYGQPAVFNSGTPVLQDGDDAALQVDVNGNLKISGVVGTSGATVGAAAPTTASEMAGVYNTTAPTYTNGQLAALQTDASGDLKVYEATKLDSINDSITVYPFGHSYVNLTTSATTTAKTGSGVLAGMVVGDPGATWQVVLYDNTAGSGTVINTFKFTAAGYVSFNAAFSTGLTAVTSGTTAGNITLIYR